MTALRLTTSMLALLLGLSLGAATARAASPVALPPTDDDLVGRQAVDMNGTNVGDIVSVMKGSDGRLEALVIKVGGKTVSVPISGVRMDGDVVRTTEPAQEIAKRPSLQDERADQIVP